jgi:iron complex transport system ATP-binding protein
LGIVSASVARMIVPWLPAREVVVSARHGALEPWWHSYSETDRAEALALLGAAGFEDIADRPFGVLSEGERQQVLLARALMISPELLLLDEPCAGLDMGGRERLLTRLSTLAKDATAPPMVMVTHHVEEIPVAFTHVLLLRNGRVLVAGPLTPCPGRRSPSASTCPWRWTARTGAGRAEPWGAPQHRGRKPVEAVCEAPYRRPGPGGLRPSGYG